MNLKFKIQNSKLNSEGFTLVELLASIIVFVAVGAVVAGIVTSSLRGSNKTNVIENIRQNGNYNLAQISKNIKYADIFGGLGNDGISFVTSCPSSTAPTPVPTTTTYSFIKITPLNGDPTVYNCSGSTLTVSVQNGTGPTPTPLIDANSFSLTGCSLSCTQTRSSDTPIIGIGFSLGPKNGGLVENSSPPILFQTSVTVRNYKR